MSTSRRKPVAQIEAKTENVRKLFERGVADIRLANEIALGTAGPRSVAAAAQQTLDLDPVLERPTSALAVVLVEAPEGRAPTTTTAADENRSGSRSRPYERRDGTLMVKCSFVATEGFSKLWRKVEGALPGSMSRNVWAEQVLTEAIHAQIARDAQA